MVSEAHYEVHLWDASCKLLESAMFIASFFVKKNKKDDKF